MTHNPAAAHPRLMALLDAFPKAGDGYHIYETDDYWYLAPVVYSTFHLGEVYKSDPDADELLGALQNVCCQLNMTDGLLAFLRRRAEEHVRHHRGYREQEARAMHGSAAEADARRRQRYHAYHHHACCTTALAAAAGTPALALLAGELQNMMEAQDGTN